MTPLPPTTLVIIGITGDLAARKLLPALEAIAKAGMLPKQFQIVGVTRRPNITVDSVCANGGNSSFVRKHLRIFQMEMDDAPAYRRLAEQLCAIEQTFGAPAQRLFYVAVPPHASTPVIELLGTSGLSGVAHTKLLLEKPFGVDLASAKDLAKRVGRQFAPEQVYRIDHYLAKEMAQNLIIFRECNSLFRRTWNNEFIERIEILASENIGIEGRAHFYEHTGALRDVVQSHLLQLAALTLMKPTGSDEMEKVSERRLAALKSLRLRPGARRGQYQGYRSEAGNPESTVETYVALTLDSKSAHFAGVPISLVTGKMLNAKTTEIHIYYKKDRDMEENELILRLQPREGVFMSVWSKRPGYEGEIEKKMLDFTYADHYPTLPDAYEKVLVDVMRSDHELFVSSEEVLASWRIIAPLQKKWSASGTDLRIYEKGSDPSTI